MGMDKAPLEIQFLYWEECPSHAAAWERLTKLLNEMNIEAALERISIETDDDARLQNFCGSPTIRINQEDIDLAGARAQRAGLNCRLYQTPEGRPSPLPSVEMIRKAIQAAL